MVLFRVALVDWQLKRGVATRSGGADNVTRENVPRVPSGLFSRRPWRKMYRESVWNADV